MGDPVSALPPNFGARGGVVSAGVVVVFELLRLPGAFHFARDAFRDGARVLRTVRRCSAVRLNEGRSVGGEQRELFGRDLVGMHDHDRMPGESSDQSEADAGIAGGGFDDGRAGGERAAGFGLADDVERDPVLRRTAGVAAFELDQHAGGKPGGQHAQFDQGGCYRRGRPRSRARLRAAVRPPTASVPRGARYCSSLNGKSHGAY